MTLIFLMKNPIIPHKSLYLNRVIHNDAERTRTKDLASLPNLQLYVERFLSYFCRTFKFSYKQGLNEICAPFILLKSREQIPLCACYNLFSRFVQKFLPNYYFEPNFQSLQSSLLATRLLIYYHLPEISIVLENNLILPDLYATSWLLTFFFSKSSLEITFKIIDTLLENNVLFFHFFILGVLKAHQEV